MAYAYDYGSTIAKLTGGTYNGVDYSPAATAKQKQQLMSQYGNSYYGNSGSSGDLSSYVKQLIESQQSAQAQAKAANEKRYSEMMTGYDDRYNTVMNSISGLGAQQAADINKRWSDQGAQQNQQLIDQGFGNSTVMPTMQMGIQRENSADLLRLNENLRSQQAGYQSQLLGDKLSAMERRTDAYPDQGNYVELLKLLGQGSGSGNVSSGGGYSAMAGFRQTNPDRLDFWNNYVSTPQESLTGYNYGSKKRGGSSSAGRAGGAANSGANDVWSAGNFA